MSNDEKTDTPINYTKTENYTNTRPGNIIEKNLLKPKSNCVNTIDKFFSEDVETVKKLEFYNPSLFRSIDATEKQSLYSLRLSSSKTKTRRMSSMELMKVDSAVKPLGLESSSAQASSNNLVLPVINSKSANNDAQYKNILEKNVYLKRLENLANETKMENEKKQLADQINQLKIEKKKINTQMLNLQNEIREDEVEMEVLQNFAKLTELTNNVSIKRFENLKNNHKKQTSEDRERLFQAMAQVQKDMDKRDRDVERLKQDITTKKEIKEKLRQKVEYLREKIREANEKLKGVKNQLMLHYHILLNEGRDTRHEGLIWIIKAIWNLGSNVIISYLPNFLDEKSIDYLFEMAHKDVELQKLKTLIDETKFKMRVMLSQRKNSKRGKRMGVGIFKTDMKIQSETKSSNPHDIIARFVEKHMVDDQLNIRKIEDMINKKDNLDEESMSLVNRISELEEIYNKFKKDMSQMKRNELNRVGKEYLVNDYQRRYSVPQNIIVSAIAGEDNTNAELLRQTREQRDYYDKLRHCRYFNFLQDYSNNKKSSSISKSKAK